MSAITIHSHLIETAVFAGDTEEAQRRLNIVVELLNGELPRHALLISVQAHLLFETEGPEVALEFFAKHGLTPKAARASVIGTHRMNLYRELGLDVDSLDKNNIISEN